MPHHVKMVPVSIAYFLLILVASYPSSNGLPPCCADESCENGGVGGDAPP